MWELRDLVARGLPVSRKALGKNKAYAASVEYVSRCVERIYGKDISFEDLDEELKFLSRRIPRVYYYALQVLWSCFDCASGNVEAELVARRHLGCVSRLLEDMGFSSLNRFLGDLIARASELAARAENSGRP
jgi:hypothetical protein